MNLEPRQDPTAEPLKQPEFIRRFKRRFSDPIFDTHKAHIEELAQLAWKAHQENHKSPATRKAGAGYKNPDYDLSVEWIEARKSVMESQKVHEDKAGPTRILLISAADRNDQSCPGEVSKTKRLTLIAQQILENEAQVEFEILDLSQMISEYGKHIFPCKACVSTSMALCHWPCSCYPNYAIDQMHDWMNEIYPMWVRAHGIFIVTPVYWYQAPSALKLMIDRLVCADGGNTDPTSTKGKDPKLAKELEMQGWDYPRHLQGRVFSVFVHGDADGADQLRSVLHNWLSDLHLISSGTDSGKARYIGYYEPYATSHESLDKDQAVHEEVRNSMRGLLASARAAKEGKLSSQIPSCPDPRPK